MDMSRSYIKAFQETLPDVDIVFDHFHVIKLLNGALDDVRKSVYQSLNNSMHQDLKKSRFLLLRNLDSLLPDEEERLQQIVSIPIPLEGTGFGLNIFLPAEV